MSLNWFRGLDVSNPLTGESIQVDLEQDNRTVPPVNIVDLGPAVGFDDLISSKIAAMVERCTAWDFLDVYYSIKNPRLGLERILTALQRTQSLVQPKSLIATLRVSRERSSEAYAEYGLSIQD